MNATYLDFLYNLGVFNIKLGLSTIRRMLDRLGNPQRHPRIIHIAGTNGKGSTLATIEKLLLDSGFTTGATISPHLVSFNERFRICGHPVDDRQLETVFETVCRACKIDPSLTNPSSQDGDIQPTFFEFSIAMAFELFRIYAVDYILLETGLGGRLDATNIVEAPLACVLTRIGIDHQEFLGQSLSEITREKLGIVKPGSPVFASWQEKPVLDQIVNFCHSVHSDLFYYPADFGYQTAKDEAYVDYRFRVFEQKKRTDSGIKTIIRAANQSLLGEHQKQNTATALAVYGLIVPESSRLKPNEIEHSLQTVAWTGRLDYLNQERTILLDGAHNESAIICLLDYLKRYHANDRILFAIGWKKDKHYIHAIKTDGLRQVEFLPVEMQSPSALSAVSVNQILIEHQLVTHPILDVKRLLIKIKEKSLPAHDILVITGSLYLLGEFLAAWQDHKSPHR